MIWVRDHEKTSFRKSPAPIVNRFTQFVPITLTHFSPFGAILELPDGKAATENKKEQVSRRNHGGIRMDLLVVFTLLTVLAITLLPNPTQSEAQRQTVRVSEKRVK